MFCKMCGNKFKDSEQFCLKCGAKRIDENNSQNINNQEQQLNTRMNSNINNSPKDINSNSSKNKKILTGTIIIEFIMLIFAILNLFKLFSFNSSTINSVEFNDTLKKYGYSIQNTTDSYNGYTYINEAYSANKDNNQIQFLNLKDYSDTVSLFEQIKRYIDKNISGKPTFQSEKINVGTYYKYSIITKNKIYILIKSENNLLFAEGDSSNKKEIKQIFTDLGYDSIHSSMLLFYIMLAILIIGIIAEWKLLEKAGLKGWYIFVPGYNLYCLFKVAFGKGIYVFLMLIPIINLVIYTIFWYKLAKAFGKSTLFSVLNIFFGIIIIQIIAFDDSKYIMNSN